MGEVHARASVGTINEGVSSLQSRAFSSAVQEKRETGCRLTFAPFFFLKFVIFVCWNLHSQFLRSDNFSRWFFSRACFKSENRTFIHLYQRYKFLTPFRMFLLCDAPLKELHACLTRDGANATFDGTNLIFAGKGIQL